MKSRFVRALLCVALFISWLVMLRYAWQAFSSLPSPERLEQSRMARIPTLGAVGWLAVRSACELTVLTALTWPVRRRYATRLAVAAVLLPLWFVATAPLTLTIMEWVHRRWLAGVWLAVLGALVATIIAGWFRRRWRDEADLPRQS